MLDIFFGISTTPPSKIKWSTPKVASPKQQSNEVSIYIAHICINFKVVFFADNFRESAILNAVLEEILKLQIFSLNQGRSIF